jgi:hypothetical protein
LTWHITLSPQVGPMGALQASVADAVITINGQAIDLGPLNDGDELPAAATDCPYVEGAIRRIGTGIYIRLLFPVRPAATEAARFPTPLVVTGAGPVSLPPNGDEHG